MSNMRQYLAWIQQNQQNNPEWKAANAWQQRNQSKTDEKSSPQNGFGDGEQEIGETPDE